MAISGNLPVANLSDSTTSTTNVSDKTGKITANNPTTNYRQIRPKDGSMKDGGKIAGGGGAGGSGGGGNLATRPLQVSFWIFDGCCLDFFTFFSHTSCITVNTNIIL